MSTIAVLQMTSGVDPAGNADTLIAGMAQAREGGADMLFAPEMALLLDRDRRRAGETMAADGYPALVDRLRDAAREHAIWATFGLPVRLENGMLANRSLLIAPSGDIAGRYDKLHMFDVDLDSGESWRESNAYQPGEALSVTGDTPTGRLGLTICYDIRFPHLHRQLAQAGASMIAVPAAFTAPTGEAHWETLLRARAIETGAFVLAPAQGGLHEDGRRTWGRSTVVGPWGEVIARADHDQPCVLHAKLDMEAVAKARAAIPSLTHDRDFAPVR